MVKLNEALVLARSRATGLENVRKFNCWGSDLTDIRIIRRMPNVQVLSLSVNKISTLSDVAYCKNLEELYIRKNNIRNLNEICYLKSLPKLRILWLADNPCANEDRYRLTVLKHLPNLQKLDNVPVHEDEINQAIEQGEDLMPPQAPTESLDLGPANNLIPKQEGDTDGDNQHNIVSASMPVFSVFRDVREDDSSSEADRNSHSNAESVTEEVIAIKQEPEDPDTLSWEETNKIRVQLGLKPLSVEKVTPMKPRAMPINAKSRNANLLQATLHLIKELDTESLEIISDAIRNRLESL